MYMHIIATEALRHAFIQSKVESGDKAMGSNARTHLDIRAYAELLTSKTQVGCNSIILLFFVLNF